MAPRRIPDDIKLADGTYIPSRHGNPEERIPADGLPDPGDLADGALDAWNELVPPLVQLGIAKAIDSVCLRGMCRWYAEYLLKMGQMAKEAEHDTPEYRRLAIGAEKAWSMFEKIASKFAMNSSDRSGMRSPKEKKGVATRKRG